MRPFQQPACTQAIAAIPFWSLVYTTFAVPGVFRSSVRSSIGLRRFGLVRSRLELVPSQNRFLAAIGESYSLRPPISAEEVCTGVITPNLIHSVRPCKLLIQFCSCLRASYFPMSDTTDSRFRFFFFRVAATVFSVSPACGFVPRRGQSSLVQRYSVWEVQGRARSSPDSLVEQFITE